ncbi:MAG: polysaccharide deacetylase family protein [Acidobacteria bacterium]|nr:polysaccharide deacetylase family protein [Acidobacteriota bacterium]MBV9923640.1 polysaccharide deacetylase family protein [Acidobacteriota bacterium]
MIDTTLMLKPLLDVVGWALVHSLWQGALVAALYACFAALVPRRAAALRYAGGVAALLLLLLLPVLTASFSPRAPSGMLARESALPEGAWADTGRASGRAPRDGKESAAHAPDGPAASAVPAAASWRGRFEERLAVLLPWLVCAWLSGVLLLASRMVGAWLLVLRLKKSAAAVPLCFEELLARVSGRLRVTRAVRLCRSALVEVPTVVGHLRPVILIPAGALLGLTTQQLEAVLAHELAHVRRYDYAVNLLQTAVETLLFYHPAAWWLSGRVRAEREHACDDAAVEATGDALSYARALAALEQLRGANAPPAALALAANGGSLMQRIQRLVNHDARTHSRRPFAALGIVFALLFGALAAQRTLTSAEAKPSGHATAAAPPRREVAVTFVNFPGHVYDARILSNMMRRLLGSLKANDVRAVGFVNEATLYREGGAEQEARVAALRDWLAAGHELGNETAHHTRLYDTSVEDFEADVVGGDRLLSKLAAERGGRVRYFSYPYLNTGATPEAKAAVEKFLSERGYRIHPVTVDSMDWLFNRAYADALTRDDEAAAASLRAEYVAYMERMFEFYENYSREVVGREIPQVLMLTAGVLNAHCFEDLAAMLKRRGYSFVTLDEATRDEAYQLPDTYTGSNGDSWLARWAVSKGMENRDVEEDYLPDSMKRYMAEHKHEWLGKAKAKK